MSTMLTFGLTDDLIGNEDDIVEWPSLESARHDVD